MEVTVPQSCGQSAVPWAPSTLVSLLCHLTILEEESGSCKTGTRGALPRLMLEAIRGGDSLRQ